MNETPGQNPSQARVPDPPETKKIVMKRVPSGKWEIKINPNIKIRDIVHLRRAMVIEFKRLKRQARMDRRVEDRVSQTKELQNVTG